MPCIRIKDGFICTIDYVERAVDAERRLRRGERQLYCPKCKLWKWRNGNMLECGHKLRSGVKYLRQ